MDDNGSKIKFELDVDYFNRAGDKVRYVGLNDSKASAKKYRVFRYAPSELIYHTLEDGTFHGTNLGQAELDVLGSWEITNDPNRVYVIDGKEWHYGDTITRYKKRSLILKPGGSDIEYVEKILIKPHKKWNEHINYHGTFGAFPKAKPRKIEPLACHQLHQTYVEKINELIAAHNARIGA